MVIYRFIYIIFCGVFSACTKDVGIATPAEPSQRYITLKQNYWRLDHVWNDTSQIAKDDPALLPLSTSYDTKFSDDSCEYFSGEKFSDNGNIYVSKGKHCGCNSNPPCLSEYNSGLTHWKFEANETKIYYGQQGYTILQLDNSTLSFYRYQTYNFTKKLVEVSIYKSYTDW